jgi:hypothetical protein
MNYAFNQLNWSQIFQEQMQNRIYNAQIRQYFYEQDSYAMQQILLSDLKDYFDETDLYKLRLVTLDQFVISFLEKMCNVYDQAPAFIYPEGAGQSDKDRFSALMDEVSINQVFQENFMQARMHNTVLCTAKHAKKLDKIFVETFYNIGNSIVIPMDEYVYEPRIMAYETADNKNNLIWYVWDRDLNEHYITEKAPEYDPDKKVIISDKMQRESNQGLWPWSVIRYRKYDEFWGCGMDGVVQLCRTLNMLLTAITDDSIRETIRLLILNFNPRGSKGDKGQIKSGLTHPIFPEGQVGNQIGPDGKILSADLYNEQILAFVDKLTDLVSSLNNIPSPLKADMTEDLAGVTLRMKSEPMLRQWGKDVDVMRPQDQALVKMIVSVNNFYRKGNQIGEAFVNDLTIKYSDPSIVTDEKAELELEQMKWLNGLSSPVKFLMSKNPNMTEDEATKTITENLDQWNEISGMKVKIDVPGDDKNLNGKDENQDANTE